MSDENKNQNPDNEPLTLKEALEREAAEDQSRLADNVETTVFEGVRNDRGDPVVPVKMGTKDMFNFRCHKGVSCWNECCHGADITLTPYDILKLAEHFKVRPAQFVASYAVPAFHEGSNLPVAKLVMTGKEGKGPCVFMDEEKGCTVYESRPATCRYYPLGLGAVKFKGHKEREDMHFLVREDHCKGHEEDNLQSVEAYRKEQGVDPYDLLNERWIGILMKMASWRSMGGPEGKDVPKQTKQMFYMIGTDIDRFRSFVFDTKFLDTYEIDDDMIESLKVNDETLLQLGYDWMLSIMFNEPTLVMKEKVLQQSIVKARAEAGVAGDD
ncbi:MAG: zinc/iron-chelating domain-containing protein [Hyphomicrobiales bacterium]|nr:MAG: zinc/iron-chelating domain-containing protein [Hyphomicrobiales bacterium]